MSQSHLSTSGRRRPAIGLAAIALAFVLSAAPPAQADNIAWANVPIGEVVIPQYEALSGKRLLVDNTVAAATITINTQHDLSPEEAVEFIKSSLLLNNFAIIEKDENTDVLINVTAKTPIGIPERPEIYIDAANFPEGDRLITYVMKLDYVAPEDALRLFQTVARPAAYSTIATAENVNALVITDNVPLVRALIKLRKEIDVPGDSVTSEAIELVRADATEVAASLDEILQKQSQNRTGASGARPNVVINPQGGAAANAPAGAVAAPDANSITIQAVSRTNSILVLAKPVDIAYIKSLIEIYDAPSKVDLFLKRELKYIPVADFLPVAEQAIARFTDGNTSGGGASRANNSQPRTTGTNTARNNTGRNNGTTNRSSTGGFGGGAGGAGGGGLSADTLGAPEPLLIGNTLIIGDPQLNNIVVSGPPEHLRIIDQLLDEIDIRPRQVYINAVIAQVTLGDDLRFGKDILRSVDSLSVGGENVDIAGVFNTTINNPATLLDPTALTDVAAFGTNATAAGFNAWANVGGFLNAYVTALESTRRFQVLSRPFVFTANNEPASIASGERVAVPTSTTSSLNSSDTINSSIGFEEVLLQLDVVPLINSKDEVTLTISQQNENITGQTVISGNSVPNISTQTFETRVRLPNKAIVVLGGIIQEDETENLDGLPFLSRVPGIKHVFGSSQKTTNRRELLIFLQPHIIESTEDLVEKNIDEINRTIVGGDAINAARSEPEMNDALFPMGERRGPFQGWSKEQQDTFKESSGPQYEPAAPAGKEQPARRGLGLFKKRINRDENTPSAPEKVEPKPKRKGLFRRR